MLVHANMPQQFWPEAIATAVYTWNRLPNSAINNKTPYEHYYGEKPDLHHMRPFGCIVYAHVPQARREKESKYLTRAHKGVFVGYDSSESWWVYVLEWRCFDISHDITFMETEFPKRLRIFLGLVLRHCSRVWKIWILRGFCRTSGIQGWVDPGSHRHRWQQMYRQ